MCQTVSCRIDVGSLNISRDAFSQSELSQAKSTWIWNFHSFKRCVVCHWRLKAQCPQARPPPPFPVKTGQIQPCVQSSTATAAEIEYSSATHWAPQTANSASIPYWLRSLTKPFWQMSSSGTVGICTISILVWYSSPRPVVAPYDDISAGREAGPATAAAAAPAAAGGGDRGAGGLLTAGGVATSSSSGGSAHGCFSPDAKMP